MSEDCTLNVKLQLFWGKKFRLLLNRFCCLTLVGMRAWKKEGICMIIKNIIWANIQQKNNPLI